MHTRLSKIALLPILLFAIISGFSVMASESSPASEIDLKVNHLKMLIEEQRELYNIPGLSLAVVKDGKVILSQGFGLKDIAENESVTSSTIFPINSTSKAFTSVLAGMRVDDGVLDWDDPVTRYLPDYRFTQDGKPVSLTLRDLLSHRSGYGRNGTLWANPQIQPAEIIKAAPRAMPLSEYQKEYHYNNVMFLAAGMATAFDQSFKWSELLKKRILVPLGMTDTTAVFADIKGDERLAQGYYWDDIDEQFRELNARNLDNIAPATGIYSNANDMAKWLTFVMASGQAKGKQLIKPSTLEETYTPTTEISPNFSYGLGWHVSEYNGQRLIEHSGNGEGYSAQVAILPESNIGFALLTNVSITPLQSGFY